MVIGHFIHGVLMEAQDEEAKREGGGRNGRPSLPPGGDPGAEKSARMQTFTPSLCPDHSTHSRSHFNNHNTVGRTDGQGEEEEAIWSVDRPSVFPLPMSPCATAFRAAPLRWERGRLACCPAAARKRGPSAAAAKATTRSFFLERKCPNSEVGRKEISPASIPFSCTHSQSLSYRG